MKLFLIGLLFCILYSCSFSHYPKKYEKLGIYSNDTTKHVSIHSPSENALKIQYLGCNNLLIKYGKTQILFDPFFSNNRGLKTTIGKIKFKPEYFNKGSYFVNRNGTSFKDINSIFISHSHYDHVLDLVYLLDKDSLNKNIKIYGDESTKTVLKNFIAKATFLNADSFVLKNNVLQKWIYISAEMRVLIIPSSHAPHIGKLHFMRGNCDTNYFNSFTNSSQKIKANQFKEGHTYAYVLDILNKDSIAFRVLIKGAGCEVNNGLISEEILKEHGIDLAILQIASANFTTCYPQKILTQVKPKQVLITHWEDFFKPYSPSKIKTIKATNFHYFFKKVKAINNDWQTNKLSDKFYMPKPGTIVEYNW